MVIWGEEMMLFRGLARSKTPIEGAWRGRADDSETFPGEFVSSLSPAEIPAGWSLWYVICLRCTTAPCNFFETICEVVNTVAESPESYIRCIELGFSPG
jgi:hypothetical protein